MSSLSIKSNFFSKIDFSRNNILNRDFVLSFILGALTTFIFPPYGLIFIGFISFSVIFVFLNKSKNATHASLIAFFFIFGLFLAGAYWIYDAVYLITQKKLWGILAVIISSFIVAIFSSILAGSYFYLKSKNWVYNAFLFGLLFSCIEFGREALLHFPWFPVALSFVNFPIFLQPIGIVGAHIYAIFLYMFFLIPAFFFKDKFFALFLIWLATLVFLYGMYCQNIFFNKKQGVSSDFYLVQPNISQKDTISKREKVLKRLEVLDTIAKDYPLNKDVLYIFPESYFSYVSSEESERMISMTEKTNVIAGRMERFKGKNYNSMVFFQNAYTRMYRKNILVPFGEYIPFLSSLSYKTFGLEAGTKAGNFNFKGINMFPLICYEIAFTAFDIKDNVNYILTISEDSWYDGRTEKSQHFAYSVLRAIEYRKPVIRVSTTGYSGFVDSYGNIIALLPNEKKAIERITAYSGKDPLSPYGQYYAKVLKWLHLFLLFLFFAERGLKIEKKR